MKIRFTLFLFFCVSSQLLYAELLLKPFLNQYQRPFTLLEIGKGDHVFWIAEKYDAVCVITGANTDLLEQCKSRSNIILLHKYFSPSDLKHLGQCERFDVILSHDVKQQFGERWKEAAEAIFDLGDYAIFTIQKDDADFKAYLEKNNGSLLGNLSEKLQLYITKAKKNLLWRKTWLWRILEAPYIIESTFTTKKLIKPSYWPPNTMQESYWLPGINLLTFKMCNGAYPTTEMIKKYMHEIKDEPHTDWMINNMILQGDRLVWIDVNDFARSAGAILKESPFNEERYIAHLELLDLTDSAQIEHFFWNKLIRVPLKQKHAIGLVGKLIEPFSLVFDINPERESLISAYLGFAAKVIAFDVVGKCAKKLEHRFCDDEVVVVSKQALEEHLGSSISLDGMIALYGRPRLCNLNIPAKDAYKYFEQLTQEISVISFKYNLTDSDSLKKCINVLMKKGYEQFNFTLRDFMFLALFENHLSSKGCGWISGNKLFQKIDEFNRLDSSISPLYGYVYARRQQHESKRDDLL